MDPLLCDNAIYEQVNANSSHEGFDMHENKCYRKVTSPETNKHEKKNHFYSKINIMVFVIVFALLLGTAGACVAFAVQISTLKSEIASLKMESSTSLHQLNTSIDMLHQQLSQELYQGKTADHPATSCKDLYDTHYASSGYYWIGEIGSPVRVYCNMSLTCGDLTGGWMRVANIDMTNTSQNCPSGLDLITSPRRLCDTTVDGCASSDFNVHGAQYSHICGRIVSYQRRFPTAFYLRQDTIEQIYVNGVSLTHGQSPRQHIWTFVAAGHESSYQPFYTCPCMNNISPATVPNYIRSDYFCDSALIDFRSVINFDIIHTSDPLWDGEGCSSNNTCCYDPQRGVNPPWFVKTLSSPTSDNIEMRLCQILNSYGGAPIEIVELYVK